MFEDLVGLTVCLRAIAEDVDVQLLRVKNRLDPGYDSRESAGYRDVGLNLRLVGARARELAVETHVCEVQLLLRPFAELKVRGRSCMYAAPEADRFSIRRSITNAQLVAITNSRVCVPLQLSI